MSSTNRGAVRAPHDFYRTPKWCVDSVYKYLDLPKPTLDPCCGDGALLGVAGSHTRGIEIQKHLALDAMQRGYNVRIENALERSWENEHIVMNPPFKDAMTWVEKSVTEALSTLVLLRLGFLASKKRKPFFDRYVPQYMAVLSKRPSFTAKGTDSADYCWLFWDRKLINLKRDTQIVWIG